MSATDQLIAEYAASMADRDSYWAAIDTANRFYARTGYSLREVRAYSPDGPLGWQGGYGLLGVRCYAPGEPTDD